MDEGSVSVLLLCITHCPKFSGLKQHQFVITVSVFQKSEHGFTGSFVLAGAATSPQGLTREEFTFKLAQLLVVLSSF